MNRIQVPNKMHHDCERVIVSLTSIKKREDALKETISCLVRQDYEFPYEVRLYISREPYLMDEGFSDVPGWINEIKKINSKCNLQVLFVRNTGPYRKLLPVLRECFADKMGCVIVTCDDDTQYAPDWLSTLLFKHTQVGGIVAFRGHTIRLQPDGKGLSPYAQWQLNPDKTHFSLMNLPTGKDGVVYRPAYFDHSVLDEDRALEIAPTTDDLWFRWHSIIRGVPCYLIGLGDQIINSVKSFEPEVSLWEVYNKKGGNDRTIEQLEQHFRSRYLSDVCSLLDRYTKEMASSKEITSLSFAEPAACAARQVRVLSMVERLPEPKCNLSARSYELFRLATLPSSGVSHYSCGSEPRTDKGGLFYAKQSVDKFDELYGWMSHLDLERDKPLITIIMTTYNAQETVEWAVKSVLAQDYRNIELIVVDDLSNDRTRDILFGLRNSDSRIQLVFLSKNRGTYFAKNVALRVSRGDYIAFQDSDDWSHPSRLRLQLWRLKCTGKLATRCNYVRHHAKLNQLVKVNQRVESPGFITLMAHRTLFEKYGFFDCSRRAADDELISRVASLLGADAIDLFLVPAYVALYSDNSLIADSSSYDEVDGIQFSLGHDREQYKQSYLQWHRELQLNPGLVSKYRFPPSSIFIEKAKSLRSFEAHEIPHLVEEVELGGQKK